MQVKIRSGKVLARKFLALVILVCVMLFSIQVKHDTSPFLESVSTYLINVVWLNPIFMKLSELGFLATQPVWVASKVYFLFNITMSFAAIILFFYSKQIVKRTLIIMALIVLVSFSLSALNKVTGIRALQVFAYQLISMVVYPFTAILLIPIFELVKKMNQVDKAKMNN
ncbi:hypothetical protein [Sediminitomix flava]|uniref:Exosortase F-associated protein n=1 Tax=Sediminitomix flava TaxID=379075 RepID=A0A315ZCK8_SEDFL|nr:hypothetical protein [Sediminitomix flava]PWJ42833.1 hypothetical protein BC781_102379 [Sediminitomix flava]